MRVVVTGGGGFLGQKLARAITDRGYLVRDGKRVAVDRVTLVDLGFRDAGVTHEKIERAEVDLTSPDAVASVLADGVESVFHLAAVVSGEAEASFDVGMAVNLYGSLNLLEACRALHSVPTVVFTSSIAVYGGESTIDDRTPITPQNSYGAQKSMVEHLVNDYSRKGFIDGRGLRLPTVIVRPGKPNRAASSFASSIVREPLCGHEAVCPVRDDNYMPVISPRRVVDALIHAHEIPSRGLGLWRTILLGGLSPTVADIIAALGRVAGEKVVKRIVRTPDPFIQTIVDGWPRRLEAARARELGFVWDASVDEIITQFVEDELGGKIA